MVTSFHKAQDFAWGILDAALTLGATSLTLQSGEGSRFSSSYPFWIILFADNEEDGYEICECTNRATDTLTITRGQEGTVAQAWSAGANVHMVIQGGHLTELQGAVELLEGTGDANFDTMQVGNSSNTRELVQTCFDALAQDDQFNVSGNEKYLEPVATTGDHEIYLPCPNQITGSIIEKVRLYFYMNHADVQVGFDFNKVAEDGTKTTTSFSDSDRSGLTNESGSYYYAELTSGQFPVTLGATDSYSLEITLDAQGQSQSEVGFVMAVWTYREVIY